MFIYRICAQYLVGARFILITASNSAWHGGEQFVFWTTVRSAVFPVIVYPSEPNWETILKAQETIAGVLSWLADWHVTIFWFVEIVNWWVFVKSEPKSWQLKEPWTTSVCVHCIYLIHEFHNLSWITEINELFHDIQMYWYAPVFIWSLFKCFLCLFLSTLSTFLNLKKSGFKILFNVVL